MHLIYPVAPPDKPYQIYESATMAIGNIAPGHRLKINGEEMTGEVSKQGYFAIKIPLKDGGNLIRCQELVQDGRIVGEATATVMVALPLNALPYDPLQIHPDTLTPQHDVSLLAGDTLRVAVSASNGADVGVLIPGVKLTDNNEPLWLSPAFDEEDTGFVDNRTRIFQEWHQSEPRISKQGYYERLIQIPPDTPPVAGLPIHLVLRNDYQERVLDKGGDAAGRLWIWPGLQSMRVHVDRAITRTGPTVHHDRLTPQRKGAVLLVDRQEGDWLRARLGNRETGGETFWIQAEDVVMDPERPAVLNTHHVSGVTFAQRDAKTATLTLNLQHADSPPPVQITTTVNMLSVFLPDTDVTVEALPAGVSVKPGDGGVAIQWQTDRLSGYDYAYTPEGLVVQAKSLPNTIGQTTVMIDPGHGGSEWGATGPSGLPEKNLNLTVAMQLANALKAKGFHVLATRSADTAVSLQQRGDEAIKNHADIFISLHHNALPDGRDPKDHEGACTFYYYPFSKPLADELQRALVGIGQNDYGVFHESFYVTRVHQTLSVLVEVGFFTRPDEFERLIDHAFQQQAVNAMADAVAAYVERD